MTREDAIDMVKHILEMMPKEPPTECDYVEEWFYEDNKIRKALNMAIKALEQEQEPCEDAVSRKSVIAIIQNHWWNCRDIDKLVNKLPSVTPQEPRVHAKILIKPNPRDEYDTYHYCSNCNEVLPIYYDKLNYCPNCGADIREVLDNGNDN